jgi:hypothetical protein
LVRKRLLIVFIVSAIVIASYLAWQSSAVAQLDSTNEQPSVEQTPVKETTKIEYHASFICGTIAGSDGPLRPGIYDTDVNIYNKQGFTIPLLWKVVINDGPSSNFKIKNLGAVTSTSLSCEQIKSAVNLDNTESFTQGFVVLRAELSPEIIGALYSGKGGTVIEQSDQNLDVLNVQSIHTVNALNDSVKQVILYKISFSITADSSGKIPSSMLSKRLYVVVPTEEYQIFDPEDEVKQVLLNKFGLDQKDSDGLQVRIISVAFSVESLKDDHALSVQQVKPVEVP